jgi:hypothetical protein
MITAARGLRIAVLTAAPSAEAAAARARREGGLLRRLGRRRTVGRVHTVYYPWVFGDWVAVVPAPLRGERRVRYTVALDGVRPFTRLADCLPATALTTAPTDAVLAGRLAPGEGDEEARELIGLDILKRYRPMDVPTLEKKGEWQVFAPVHVVELEGEPPGRWMAIDPVEGLTAPLSRRRELLRFLAARGLVPEVDV